MTVRILVLLLTGVLLGAASTRAQSPPASPSDLVRLIDETLDDTTFANAWWAALVVDLERNAVLYRRNASKSFTPASNTKLYTTAAVLDLLGPDYRYTTSLFIDGPVVDETLDGNLIVRGSGDPVIGGRFNDGDRTEVFRAWADSLRALGIHHVDGDLIGDDDVFDDTPLGYGWSWDDLPYWYAAEISGLSLNDNNVDFTIQAQRQGQPGVVHWEPHETDYVHVINGTRTIHPDSSLDEEYTRNPGTNTIELASLVPEGRLDKESLTVTNPTRFFVHVLRESLVRSGISVTGRPVDVDDLSIKPNYESDDLQRIAVHVSPPLTEIVQVLNKRSQNLYAEQLLRTLAAERPIEGDDDLDPGSAAMGIEAAMETFVQAGIDTSRIQLADGSGLSRHNLVTAEMTMSLLQYVWSHPDSLTRAAFVESLPIGGVDGTLEYRYADGAARGNVQAKTGTLSNVSALSGYVTSARETPLAFVLMCNHYTVDTDVVREAQDQIVNHLARYRR